MVRVHPRVDEGGGPADETILRRGDAAGASEKGIGSQPVIVALLKAGVDAQARDIEGMNALIHAVREGGCGLQTGAGETQVRSSGSGFLFELLGVPRADRAPCERGRSHGDPGTARRGDRHQRTRQPGSYRADDGGWRGQRIAMWSPPCSSPERIGTSGTTKDGRPSSTRPAAISGRHSVPCPPAITATRDSNRFHRGDSRHDPP